MMTRRLTLALTCVQLLACGATLKRPSPAELQALDGDARAATDETREKLKAAEQTLADLEASVPELERDVEIAERLIERETADVEVTRLRFEAAQATRDADAMIPARSERERAATALEVARAQLVREEAALDLLTARIDEAAAAVDVAEAELALVEVQAVQNAGNDESPEASERVAAFETQLAEARATAAAEKQSVARLETQYEKARQSYENIAGPVRPQDGAQPKPASAP